MKWQNTHANTLLWNKEIANREQKEKVAAKLVLRVKDGDVIGLGSGSTSFIALLMIGEKIKHEGLRIVGIPTSKEIELACSALDIPVTSLLQKKPDWCFDGADEADPQGNLIKGRGGAMFLEKLVMKSSSEIYILVDETKRVERLGQKFCVPIEVYPLALHFVESQLRVWAQTEDIKLRMAERKDGPVVTETGNLILDVKFNEIPLQLESEIKLLPGVIESGLFMGYNPTILS